MRISDWSSDVCSSDLVKDAIAAAGGQLHMWRLAIRPGKPVALGQIGAVPVFGLPGNPVAAALTFAFFAGPLLQRLGGYAPLCPRGFPVTADFAWDKKPGRREWLRVSLQRSEEHTSELQSLMRIS